MTISLFYTDSENNRIQKHLISQYDLTGTVKDPTNIKTPSITCQLSATYLDRNYAFIPEFGRYYFITNKTIIGTNLVVLELKVDVLMSFSNVILVTPMLIERSEIYPNDYIADSQRVIYNYPMTLTKRFPQSFDSFNFFLTTAGN